MHFDEDCRESSQAEREGERERRDCRRAIASSYLFTCDVYTFRNDERVMNMSPTFTLESTYRGGGGGRSSDRPASLSLSLSVSLSASLSASLSLSPHLFSSFSKSSPLTLRMVSMSPKMVLMSPGEREREREREREMIGVVQGMWRRVQ